MDSDDTISAALAECLQRLKTGDLSARDRIIEVCSDRLRVLAHRMLGRYPGVRRWEDTDDVFQNAAMRLHRALGAMQFDMPRSVMALAATQLHRELIDLARRHAGPASYAANHGTNAMPKAAEDEGPDHYIDNQSANDSNLDRWTLFHEAIANLPENDREVFHLVWYLGADQKTIASLLDCSERTVKYRWRSAREAVREALDGKPPQP
jgi:RNA polymerase sigma-70 factor (ECF subfamily)